MTATMTHEPMEWLVFGSVQKWDGATIAEASKDLHRPELISADADTLLDLGIDYDRLVEFEGNNLLNAGITRVLNLLTSTGAVTLAASAYTNTTARIGVGDSTVAFAATQTDLQAATNKYYQLMDATYPTVSAQTATFRSTIADPNGNFSWQEWVIDNGTASSATGVAPALNRRVVNLGTKASGSWALSVTLTLS
ncbi:MAG: hypothetical protein NVSMB70_18430 [Chamaesiphon sp.]